MTRPQHCFYIISLGFFSLVLLGVCFFATAYAFEYQYVNIYGSITAEIKGFNGGEGTIGSPYEIANEKQLNYAVKYWRDNYTQPAYFRQIRDIIITQNWTGQAEGNFFPFGLLDISAQDDTGSYYPFRGTYDGGGYTISGLNIQNDAYAALFSVAESATLTNIHITGSSFSGGEMSAAIAGIVKDCTISLCSANTEVNSQNVAAGIVASAEGSLENGNISMIIRESYNSGKIYGEKAAGIVCETGRYTQISDVYNTGSINGLDWASGIGGSLADDSEARNLVSLGKVTCSQVSNAYSLFTNTLASGRVQGAYYFADAAGQNFFPSNNVAGSLSRYDTQLRNSGNFVFTRPTAWFAEMRPACAYYPFVQLTANPHRYENTNGHYMHGSGSSSFPFIAENAGTMRLIGNKNNTTASNIKPYTLSAGYILAKDVDMLGQEWEPIGNSNRFTGVFNGNDKTIFNLSVNRTASDYIGFFGRLNNAAVSGLNIRNAVIYGRNNAGILAGEAAGTSAIRNCAVWGNITGSDYIGGLAGCIGGAAQIKQCYSGGSVTASNFAGGFVGCVDDGTLTECFSVSDVRRLPGDFREAGGFVGRNDGTITDCYSTGSVDAGSYTGGFVGNNYDVITRCFSVGRVYSGSCSGGFAGLNYGEIMDCYWDTKTSELTDSMGGTGKKTDEMFLPQTYAGWSPAIWIIESNNYPKLRNISLEAQMF